MSYTNFKPTIWSKKIQHELPKYAVFREDCDFQFEGDAGLGKTVKILGVSKPTIGTYAGTSIGSPEVISDTAQTLSIDQHKYFNFMVDDVDRAQSIDGLMEALLEETTRALAADCDTYIVKDISTNAGKTFDSTEIETPAQMKAAIDAALITLWNNGVNKDYDKVTIYLNPWMYVLFQEYLITNKTNNDALVANGEIGRYCGAVVKMSNNLYNDGTDDYAVVKTSKGYAFCDCINETEAYRPEGLFADAVKGLHTYGGKVVRKKEICAVKLHQKASGSQSAGGGGDDSGTESQG